MPEYKIETLCKSGFKSIEKFNIIIEDKIYEYIQNGYKVFSHQMTVTQFSNMIVQIVFIKED